MMKMKSFLKKATSMALSIVMLCTCSIIAPLATAEDSWYNSGYSLADTGTPYVGTLSSGISNNNIGKYRVRLCVLEMDGFDASIHDRPGGLFPTDYPYEPGFAYGLYNSQRNLNGTSINDDLGTNTIQRASSLTQHKYWCEYAQIRYKINNGLGTGTSDSHGNDTGMGAVWFNLGDQDATGRNDIISGGEYNYGYFPSDDGVLIDGFPTGFTTRYYEKGDGSGQYAVYLQVAVWDDSEKGYHWEEGTCTGTPALWGSVGGGWDSKYAGGILYAQTELISTKSTGTELLLSSDLSDSSSQDKAAYPYACTAEGSAYTASSATIPAVFTSSSTNAEQLGSISCPSESGKTTSAYVSYSSPKDQYGAVMTTTIRLQTSREDKTAYFTQNNRTAKIAFGANILNGANEQQLRAIVTWQQKVNTTLKKMCVSTTNVLQVKDAQYDVNWLSDSGQFMSRDTYYYGDTPVKDVPYKAYDTVHYILAGWNHAYEQVTNLSNNSYQALYTTAEHQFSTYTKVDSTYHRGTCAVDADDVHYVISEHNIIETVVPASCNGIGYTRHQCEQCGYYYDTDVTPKLSHKWDNGVITTEPKCEETGIKTFTCEYCGEQKTSVVSALGHLVSPKSFVDEDGRPNGIYFSCDRDCGAGYWAAAYNEATGRYFVPDETEYESIEAAVAASDIQIGEPVFNIFNDTETKQDYRKRGASLKYSNEGVPVTQPLRFMASVLVPENVSFGIGGEGNAISDVGFVYSLKRIIGEDKNALKIGKTDVYGMSVKERNANSGVYNGSNWGGVSKHEDASGTHLTFNVVIQVLYSNWEEDFCARAYVKYNCNGFEYTVYDDQFSARSVAFIADKVVNNPDEPEAAREYCQKVILDNLA